MAFWAEQVSVVETKGGVVVALPLLYPNGIQVIVYLQQISSGTAIISDNGEVISALNENRLAEPRSSTREVLEERAKAFELTRRGMVLEKAIKLPLDGLDVHLFGEALVSIAHLIYRHDPEVTRMQHVYGSIRKLLLDCGLAFKENDAATVTGKVEKAIRVDFLANGAVPLACKAVERRGRMRDYMEQWGYRWRDAKDKNPKLVRSMFYDPENQIWDSETLSIGRSVCEIFQPYSDYEAIRRDIDRYRKVR